MKFHVNVQHCSRFADANAASPAPGTRQPITPDDLSPIFPMEIIKQEASQERWIDIPEQVLDIYRLWRPAPLYRARNLEKLLDTPAKIYYKYEGSALREATSSIRP